MSMNFEGKAMSMNFERPVDDDETIEKIKKVFGEPAAHDRKTFLSDRMTEIKQATMNEIANSAKQVTTVEVNGEGDIKTMADGTRYQVTPQGWRKLGSGVSSEGIEQVNFLNEHEAAERLGVTVHALRKWRVNGTGPAFLKLGRAVRYDADDLAAWCASRRRRNTSEAA